MSLILLLVILLLIIFVALLTFCNSTRNLFGGYRTSSLDRKTDTGRDLYSAIDMRHDKPVCNYPDPIPIIGNSMQYPYDALLRHVNVQKAKFIGSGSIGSVFLCESSSAIENTSNRIVCIKITRSLDEATKNHMILLKLLEESRRIIGTVDNKIERIANDYRICAIYKVCTYNVTINMAVVPYHMIFMQNMCGFPLLNIIYVHLALDKLKVILFNLICGVYALHKVFHILHRDLKLDNIMFADRMVSSDLTTYANLRIIDWGFATPMGDNEIVSVNTICGTILYIPPRQIMNLAEHRATLVVGYRDDIFALGTIMYNLITGSEGYYGSGLNEQILLERARAAIRDPEQKNAEIRTNILRRYSDPNLINLILGALDIDETRRSTVADLINNPFFDDIPLNCIPNFLYQREEYIRRLDINTDETNRFIIENREIDPPLVESEEEEAADPMFLD